MTKRFLMLFVLAGFAFGQAPAKAAKPAVKPAVKKADTVTLPPGAKATGDGAWEHTDGQGKQWVYKQMPFGLTRMAKGEADERSAAALSLPPGMTVVEKNGGYEFSRATPFGGVTYMKKADELSETERALVAAKSRKRMPKEAASAK
jgi:hypothetical protein